MNIIRKFTDISTLIIILILYYIFSFGTLFVWNIHNKYSVTGDEPHYLVMASGIIKYGTLEQTKPYKEEFTEKKIFPAGLADSNAYPTSTNTHCVDGPNGLYNVHNIGLPLLLAIPYALGGVVGSKIFMILVNSFFVIIVWKLSNIYISNIVYKFCITLALTFSLPFVPASNQIYGDLLAGNIALLGVYFLMTIEKTRSKILWIFYIFSVVYLPWLQLKFAPASLILICAYLWKIAYKPTRDISKVILVVLLCLLSFSLLLYYNYCAFGSISGPFLVKSGAFDKASLELSKDSLMVLIGLFLDQNQGLLFQAPIYFIGLISLYTFFKLDYQLFAIWSLIFLSFMVPNGLHPNWYGGFSFSGRFQWAGAVVFLLPTIIGLSKIANKSKNIFIIILIVNLLLQSYFYYLYTFSDINIFNKGSQINIYNYSIYYDFFSQFLPAFNNSQLAFHYLPNYFWFILSFYIIYLGFQIDSRKYFSMFHYQKILASIFIVTLFFIFFQASFPPKEEYTFKAVDLPSEIGTRSQNFLSANLGKNKKGFLSYGPYIQLKGSEYQIDLKYKSELNSDLIVGNFDVYIPKKNFKLFEQSLTGTNGKVKILSIKIDISSYRNEKFEFRNFWFANAGDLNIESIVLKRVR